MKKCDILGSLRAFFLVSSLLLGGVSSLPAQEGGEIPIIREIAIEFEGPQTISRERVLANLVSRVGDPYSQLNIENDIKSLYATGQIDNVRVGADPVANGLRITYTIEASNTVAEIRFEGNEKYSEKRLRKKIDSKEGQRLQASQLGADAKKIEEYYDGKGYADVEVKFEITPTEDKNLNIVTFVVDEGQKVVLRDIEFEGNTVFSDRELLKKMKVKGVTLVSFLTKSWRLDRSQLDEDIVAIEQFYQNEGYIDAQVVDVKREQLNKRKVDLVVTLEEGPQYKVGAVKIEGMTIEPSSTLEPFIELKSGGVYSPSFIRNDLKFIEDFYGSRGYADARVGPVTDATADPLVLDLTYQVLEGEKSYLNKVNIEGNVVTKDRVIRREVPLVPGEEFNTVRVNVAKQRLENLGYFSKVDIFPTPTVDPTLKDLNIIVEEQPTGSLNFGVGFSSIDSIVGFVDVSQSNFDITDWPGFRGAGQRFRARLQYGDVRRDFIMSLTEPWLFGRRLAGTGEVYYRDLQNLSDDYEQRNIGTAFSLRKPITRHSYGRVEYRLQEIKLFNFDDNVSDTIRAEEGSFLQSRLRADYNYDRRDSLFLPRRGLKVNVGSYISGEFLGGDVDTYGFDLEAAQYIPLPFDTVLSFEAGAATVDSISEDESTIPIFEREFLGGANDLRGFDYREVGPKDENGEPIGGRTMAYGLVEFSFPIFKTFRGVLFYDIGFVNADAYDFSTNNYNSDYGVGVRFTLPQLGLVRIDYGFPLETDEFNDSSGKFNFNLGYKF